MIAETFSEAVTEEGCEPTEFKFAELSDTAKCRARDWYSIGEAHDWAPEWDYHLGPLEYLGIDIDTTCQGSSSVSRPDVNYSVGDRGGFANFEGTWFAHKCDMSKLVDECDDEELHGICARLSVMALQWPDSTATIRRLSRKGSVACAITTSSPLTDDWADDQYWPIGKELDGIMKDVCHWLFRALESDYEECFDTERIEEGITGNDYTFDRDGNAV